MPDPTHGPSDGADIGARLGAIAAWGDPGEVPDLAHLHASTTALAPLRAGRSVRRWVPLTAVAAAVAVILGIIAVTAPSNGDIDVEGGSDFASAIEASGVLTSPSTDEVEQAMDPDLYKPDTGQTQVSAAGNYVSLRTCRSFGQDPEGGPSPACPAGFPAGWAYEAGTADGDEVHHGLLGEANEFEVHVLDDRFFVAVESAPDAQAPPSAWLIDAASGRAGLLNWRDTATTLRSPAQALLVCEDGSSWCSLRIVDARDGTIQPLVVPDDAAPGLPVTQHGGGRIWVATAPHGDQLGLAYSDDGGETWTDVALPEQMAAISEELSSDLAHEDKLLEIAADGDRVAVTFSWGWGGRETTRDELYVSDDAGRSWTTPAPSEPRGNGARLYVLADGQLVLRWSVDSNPVQVLVSTGTDWAALEHVDAPEVTWDDLTGGRDFSVNRAGVAFSSSTIHDLCELGQPCTFPNAEAARLAELDGVFDVTIQFSTDLTNWTTIEELND